MHGVGAGVFAFALVILQLTAPAFAENRVALVIGNDLYPNLGPTEQLQRARSDARSVGDSLAALGFAVARVENASRQQMVDALFNLTEKIEPGDTTIVFYAGHGVAIDGGNYLLPVDIPTAGSGQESRIRNAAIAEASIISDVKAKGARVLVMILDACRNNPFRSGAGRSIGGERGLARIDAPGGVFGIYSAGYGESALDRLDDDDPDPSSVFTRTLLTALRKPDLTLVQIAKETQQQVQVLAASVSHEQTPGYYDQIVGNVVLNPSRLDATVLPPAPAVAEAVQVAPPPSLAGEAQTLFDLHVSMGMRSPDDALDYVREHYAATVRYYGKQVGRDAIIADKARYFAKRPTRNYALVPGTTSISCDEAARSCRIAGQTDYTVSNGQRTLAGRALVELEASFADDRGQITLEDGRPIK